jgi:hypothetical protein
MAMTKVEIISNALALLGQKPINSLTNQNNITSAAEQAFDFILPVILSTGFWRFATKQVQLSQLNITPPTTIWNYVYELPSDYLKMVRQIPHNWAYEIFTDRQMYSNIQGPLFIEYVFQPDVGQLPYYFNAYLVYKIAEYLALSSAQNVEFSAKLNQDMGIAMAVALAADCQNRPTTPMISQPIIADRAVSFFVYG